MYIKASRLILLGLVLAAIMMYSGSMHKGFCLNLAHIELMRWTFLPQMTEPKRHLSAALRWGERAGAAWMRHGHGERAQVLWARVQSDEWRARQQSLSAYQRGQRLEREGHIDLALAAYKQAFANGRSVEAGYAVYRLGKQIGQSALAQSQIRELEVLVPEYQVSTALADGTRLIGYDLDEWGLERDDDAIPITLYWELPDSLGGSLYRESDGWTYVGIHNRLYQIGVVDNLLPNGGFERDLSTVWSIPGGYGAIGGELRKHPDRWSSRFQLADDTRQGKKTRVVAMIGLEDVLNGITPLETPTVEPGKLYIYGGWMRVTGTGSGSLGGVWLSEYGPLQYDDPAQYTYPARDLPAQPWQHEVLCMLAHRDAVAFFPYIFKKSKGGVVYFDDLVFFQLPVPMDIMLGENTTGG